MKNSIPDTSPVYFDTCMSEKMPVVTWRRWAAAPDDIMVNANRTIEIDIILRAILPES